MVAEAEQDLDFMTEMDIPASMRFHEKLCRLMKDRGWGPEQLGQRAGIKAWRISRWLKPTGEPGPAQLLVLARALGVSVEFLADDSMDEQPPDQALMVLLGMWRAAGLPVEEAYRRLFGGPIPGGGDCVESADQTAPAQSPRHLPHGPKGKPDGWRKR